MLVRERRTQKALPVGAKTSAAACSSSPSSSLASGAGAPSWQLFAERHATWHASDAALGSRAVQMPVSRALRSSKEVVARQWRRP